MKRIDKLERKASAMMFAYLISLSFIVPVGATAIVGMMTGNAILGIGAPVVCVLLYFAASNAARKAQYWSRLASEERRFDTVETLDGPRWVVMDNNHN